MSCFLCPCTGFCAFRSSLPVFWRLSLYGESSGGGYWACGLWIRMTVAVWSQSSFSGTLTAGTCGSIMASAVGVQGYGSILWLCEGGTAVYWLLGWQETFGRLSDCGDSVQPTLKLDSGVEVPRASLCHDSLTWEKGTTSTEVGIRAAWQLRVVCCTHLCLPSL